MSTKSKYRVQSNELVVDKSKEAKKSIFLKTFAVRMGHMHSKGTSLSCAWPKRTVKMARVHHARPRRPTRVRGHLFAVCPKPGARPVVYKCSKPLHIDSARCCAPLVMIVSVPTRRVRGVCQSCVGRLGFRILHMTKLSDDGQDVIRVNKNIFTR
jgi:hypothetical protein